MHIICSNFGSIQPESKVAVWSTSAKPAMPGSQAGSSISQNWTVEGQCAKPPAAVAEPEGSDIAKHGDIEDEVAIMSQKEQLMLSPAQFKDIATGEPIPNQRCLNVCHELDCHLIGCNSTPC